MRSKPRRFLELALLMGGIAGLGIWGWSTAREGLYEDWHNWIFDRQASATGATVGDYVKDRLSGSAKSEKSAESATTAPARYAADPGLLGRLRVPRLNLQAIVREGTEEKTLSLSLGHVVGTAKPGQNGNVAVAGHRDSLFRGLRNIQVNDQIVFETVDGGTFTYQVTGTRVVKPTEVSVLNAGLYPELTLVTCYPFNYIGSAPERFIVKAKQISQTTRGLTATEIAQTEQPTTPTPPPPAPPLPVSAARPRSEPPAKPRGVPFEVAMNHSRQLAPGISIGLTKANAERKTVDGWMWVMPDRRTIWLRDQSTQQPIVIHSASGERREVVIDSVTRNSMRGYIKPL